MSTDAYNDILQRAKRELTDDERIRLSGELARKPESANGDQDSRSLLDALQARGLIGFMQDGPTDLSTNPIHMEGFGKHGA